jgi:hypothetical protein
MFWCAPGNIRLMKDFSFVTRVCSGCLSVYRTAKREFFELIKLLIELSTSRLITNWQRFIMRASSSEKTGWNWFKNWNKNDVSVDAKLIFSLEWQFFMLFWAFFQKQTFSFSLWKLLSVCLSVRLSVCFCIINITRERKIVASSSFRHKIRYLWFQSWAQVKIHWHVESTSGSNSAKSSKIYWTIILVALKLLIMELESWNK